MKLLRNKQPPTAQPTLRPHSAAPPSASSTGLPPEAEAETGAVRGLGRAGGHSLDMGENLANQNLANQSLVPQSPARLHTLPGEETLLRPHQFDGIQELDNPMPNWWLGILFASIAFGLGYWTVMHSGDPLSPGQKLRESMARSAEDAAKRSGQLSSSLLWKMSRDPSVVASGKTVYLGSCAPCHLPDLAGAIGPNLKDTVWIHGGDPMTILRVITEGVAVKGMPTWGPVLGRQKIAEVTAFILSHHQESASPPPPAPSTAPATPPNPSSQPGASTP